MSHAVRRSGSFEPRSTLSSVLGAVSPGSRVAAGVAFERARTERMTRLLSVTRDRARESRHPRRQTMRGLMVGRGARLTWRTMPEPPPPGPLGAVVAPLAMATCDMDRPVGLAATPFPLPLHLGHECVAEVLSVGSAVQTVAAGDRVVVPFQISCGDCPACRLGLSGNCRSVPPLSMFGFGVVGGLWGGAIADQLPVPFADAMLVPLPAGVSPVAAASAADTLSDAYRHVAPYVAQVRDHPDGPRVVVVGAMSDQTVFSGSVPLYVGLVAQALLPEAELLLVDQRTYVREQAERFGIEARPPAGLRGHRAALVVDCSTSRPGLGRALRAVAPDGHCSCAGTLHASVPVPGSLMFGRNATLTISRSHIRSAIPGVLDLMASGRLRPEAVITTLGLYEDAPALLRHHLLQADTKTVLVRDQPDLAAAVVARAKIS